MSFNRFTIVALIFGLGFLLARPPVQAQGEPAKSTTQVRRVGNGRIDRVPLADTGEFAGDPGEVDSRIPSFMTGSMSFARVPSAHVPRSEGSVFANLDAGFFGFNGLTHRDSRLADNGNQLNIEPPDQALAVGGGYIVEAVNSAIAVYDTSGNLLAGPTALNPFFGLASAFVPGPPFVLGPFLSDPKAYFDPAEQRFFVTITKTDTDPVTFEWLGHREVRIAVSRTSDPTGDWNIFALDVTNDRDDVYGPCPCLGDQPLIGADRYGFYINTNALNLDVFGPIGFFRGTNIYAISKRALVTGTGPTIPAVRFHNLTTSAGAAFSMQPATSPAAASWDTANRGTEYFVNQLDPVQEGDPVNGLVVWALTNTSSLASGSPDLTLSRVEVPSESYSIPPFMEQRRGPLPLGDAFKQHLELLFSNDDRVNQVVLAAGKLWTGVDTSVSTPNGPVRAGIAWFILNASATARGVSASVANQGYIAVDGPKQENVVFPSIGVTADGHGVMAFSLVGESFFPSAAYVPIDVVNGAGAIRIAAPGAGPNDGYTGYPVFTQFNAARWGDYTAAVADADGHVWFAVEYIPNLARSTFANWGTFIGELGF